MATVLIDRPLPHVARITLDRPPVNALGRDLVQDLRAAVLAVSAEPDLRCVLLTGRGKAFCAGADLKERAGLDDERTMEVVRGIGAAVNAVAAIPVPTVAVVNGAALGGGFELALACDIRIAAADAPVGLPECALAIIPGAGGTQRLARLVGPGVAKRWVLGARIARAEEAVRDLLVNQAFPAGELDAAALTLAGEIARCGPLALRAAKRAIDDGLAAGPLAAGLDVEWQNYLTTIPTADRREALRAFKEKRPPDYRGS